MSQKWEGHASGSRQFRRLIWAMFFAGMSTFSQIYASQSLLPELSRQFRTDAASVALTISAATVGMAVAVIPWSMLSDRIGRVKTMSASMIAATLIFFAVGFSQSLGIMLALRLAEGVAIAGVMAAAIAYISDEVRWADVAKAAGFYVAGSTVGGLWGRILASLTAEITNWRLASMAVVISCAITLFFFILLAPKAKGFTRRYLRSRENNPGFTARLGLVFTSRRMWAMYAQGFLFMGGFVALYNFLGFHLRSAPFLLPGWIVGFVFLAYLAGTFSSVAAGAWARKMGRLPVLALSAGVMGVGILLTLAPTSLITVLAGLVIATAGFFAAHSIASSWTSLEKPAARAQAASVYNLFFYLGSSLFGWLGGRFYNSFGWAGEVTMIMTLIIIAFILAISFLRQPKSGQSGK